MRPGPVAGTTAESAQRVARRYLSRVGRFATPERVDVYHRGDRVIARYRLTQDTFADLAERYRLAAEDVGITAVPYFPLLAASGPPGDGMFVIRVAADSPLAAAGVAPGAVIDKVGEQYVSTPDELAKALRRTWRRTGAGTR